MKHLKTFNKAVEWIENNTLENGGITVTSKNRISYPEVTGYYIPTLIKWGYRDLAIEYGKWLCEIQKEDGSWYSSDNAAPYVFDSAQILKGLIELYNIYPECKENIIKGCDWILTNMDDNGKLPAKCMDAWGDGSACREEIHLYCLSPLIAVSQKFNIPVYEEKARKILNYYIEYSMDELMEFRILSHFYAYEIEALVDLGEIELAKKAMEYVAKFQAKNGAVPGYKNRKWVCSTGLFQFALIWFKLGEYEKGNKAFEYASSLQNISGGWYGSYPRGLESRINKKKSPNYFPDQEISWAVKYYLDALHYKLRLEFEEMSPIFSEHIDKNDGRYQLIRKYVQETATNGGTVCDVGCGKGRYILNLIKEVDDLSICAVDISSEVMKNIPSTVEKRQGALTKIPAQDEEFNLVYTVEALEHAVHYKNAIKELTRITKKNGKIIIIDKSIENLGKLKLSDFEQWFSDLEMKNFVENILGYKLTVIKGVPYEDKTDELFHAWIIQK